MINSMLEFKNMNLNSSTKTENPNGEQSNEVTKTQCSFCEKTFYNAYYLDMHIKISHDGEGLQSISSSQQANDPIQNECNFCSKIFINNDYLKLHTDKLHEEPSETFKNLKLNGTLDGSETCYPCEKTFETNGLLETHFGIEHKEETKEFKCNLCSKTYEEKIDLYEHMKYLHYDATNVIANCKYCSKKFLDFQYLQRHIDAVHKKTSEKSFNSSQKHCMQRKKVRFGTNRSQPKDQESLLEGVFAKMGISEGDATKNHKCIKCNKSFPSTRLLKYHMLYHIGVVQPRLKSHECDDCEETFTKRHDLMKHKEDSHPKAELDLSLNCGSCDKVFQQGNHLKKHENTVHKVMKQYKCKNCEKQFTSRGNRRNHAIKVHAGPNSVPIFKTDKTIITPKQLSYEFDNALSLPSDKGKDKLKCEFCGKTFKGDMSLKVHFRVVHKRDKKLACNFCNKEFNFSATLKTHMDIVHKNEPTINVANVANLLDNMEI